MSTRPVKYFIIKNSSVYNFSLTNQPKNKHWFWFHLVLPSAAHNTSRLSMHYQEHQNENLTLSLILIFQISMIFDDRGCLRNELKYILD